MRDPMNNGTSSARSGQEITTSCQKQIFMGYPMHKIVHGIMGYPMNKSTMSVHSGLEIAHQQDSSKEQIFVADTFLCSWRYLIVLGVDSAGMHACMHAGCKHTRWVW